MSGSLPRNRGNRSADRVGSLVSRRLRAAGVNVSPSARKHRYNGLFVSGKGDRATITIDLGVPDENQSVAFSLVSRMMQWDDVKDRSIDTYTTDHGAVLLWVSLTSVAP